MKLYSIKLIHARGDRKTYNHYVVAMHPSEACEKIYEYYRGRKAEFEAKTHSIELIASDCVTDYADSLFII